MLILAANLNESPERSAVTGSNLPNDPVIALRFIPGFRYVLGAIIHNSR